MKDKKNFMKVGGAIIFLAIVILVGYYFVNNYDTTSLFSKNAQKTNATKLIEKDLDRFYPSTPSDVVDKYSNYLKCLYNDEYTDEEYEKLFFQLRKFFDDLFLEENPVSEHMNKLHDEIAIYKTNSKKIASVKVQSTYEGEKYTANNSSMCSLVARVMLKTGSNTSYTYEKFCLRENPDGKWKIVGWEVTDPVEIAD